jgi:uncharacterized protein YraI
MNVIRMRLGPAHQLGSALAIALLLGLLAPYSALADTDLDSGGIAVIAYADGDSVRLRSGPGTDTDPVALLAEGTQVRVQGGPVAGSDDSTWFEVIAGDDTGYVVADFLADSGQLYSGGEGPAIANTAVHLRAGPGTSDPVVATLGYGDAVTVTGPGQRGWFPVSSANLTGFVYSAFLTPGTGGAGAITDAGVRYVLESVRLRSGPGTSYGTITVLAIGTRLDFTGEVRDQFARVSSSAGSGWVAAQYIGPSAPGGASGTRYTIDTVHLRTGPGTSYRSLTYLPVGVKLSLLGATENGFARVSSSYGTGWVSTRYIGSSAASTTSAWTNDSVNFRSGPGQGYSVIRSLPVGAKLQLLGSQQSGFSRVTSGSTTGWVATPYISSVAPQYTGGTRYTSDSVNLRRSPSLNGSVIRVIPSRTTVTFTGTVENNYARVRTSFGDGWISADYMTKTRPTPPSGSRVVWPVKGGEWRVSQGYNGSSHQNTSSAWQYYYSFDLKRTSGSTAWQPVYAPVDGTIRWIDESTGGMSIYMGDDLAFAMFHVIWAGGIREGQTITQGQYLGVIAPAGQAGNGGSPHLHITGWKTWDGGNWSRVAQPFVGRFAIEGVTFPESGARNDYLNYTFTP